MHAGVRNKTLHSALCSTRNTNSVPGVLPRSSHWEMRCQQASENAQSLHSEDITPCPSAVLLHIICSSRRSLCSSQAPMLWLITVGSQAAVGPWNCLSECSSPAEAETASQGLYFKHISRSPLFASSKNSHRFY